MGLSGVGLAAKWLRGLDLNQRPLGYEPSARLWGPLLLIGSAHSAIYLFYQQNPRHRMNDWFGALLRSKSIPLV